MAKDAEQQPGNTDVEIRTLTDQNRRLTEEVKRRVDQLAAINSVAAVVSQSLDLEDTLQSALGAVMRVINVEATGISLVDTEAGDLVLRAQRGWKRDFVEMGMRMPKGEGLAWYVIDNDEMVVTGDISQDSRIIIPAFQEEGVMAMALAPMHARGRTVGVLSAMSYSPYQFSQDELAVLQAVADQVGVALDNALLHGQSIRNASRLRAVLNSTADGILSVDMEGVITLANAEMGRLCGAAPDDLIGRRCELFPTLPESLAAALRQAMQRTDEGTLTLDGEIPGEEAHQRRYLSYLISPVHDPTGEPQGWVAVVRDVTHIKEMEILKSRTIRHASHDLRNPLSISVGAIQVLRQTWESPTDQQQLLLDMALTGMRRMQDLIENLLNLERIEAGVDTLNEPIDLLAIIAAVVEELALEVEVHQHTLAVDVPDNVPILQGSPDLLTRVISNMVENAIKYTDEGGMIEVRVILEKAQVKVEVADNGRGIAPEEQSRLFEKFYRVKTAENEGVSGTGLGLAIVKSIVEQHGGHVYVHSEPGVGSTFGFALPIE
jgi:two-component system phosphate regulon sensor histidine kinase PhoR